MKKFFLMVVLVSTFFLGLSAMVDRAGAKFKSDAQALELIRLARIAIGGDANINNVRSMTINANSTHYFEKNGSRQPEPGSLEINLQLPNMFSKIVRIGATGSGDSAEKDFDVLVINKDENAASGEKQVFVFNKSDDESAANEKSGEKKIVIRKNSDGAEEIKQIDGKNVILENKSPAGTEWVTKDGNRMLVRNEVKTENISGNSNNELFRMTMALLLSAPGDTDAAYKFAGEAPVDGNVCSVILVETGGSAFKLFLDKNSYLPRMVSFTGSAMPNVVKIIKDGDVERSEKIVEFRSADSDAGAEHQLKFADFRNVGGVLLPFRWTEAVAGIQSQTIEVSGYEINPANIADKFKSNQIFVRKMKDQ